MNAKKYRNSSIAMILILFVAAFYQAITIAELQFLEQSSSLNDVIFTIMATIIVLVIAFFMFYIPTLLMVEVSIKLKVNVLPITCISTEYSEILYSIKRTSRKYLRLNVIRC